MKNRNRRTALAALLILGAAVLPAHAGLLGGSGLLGGRLGAAAGPQGLDLAGAGRASGQAQWQRPELRPLQTLRPRSEAALDAAGQARAEAAGRAQRLGDLTGAAATAGAAGAQAARDDTRDTARQAFGQPLRAGAQADGGARLEPQRAEANAAGRASAARGERTFDADASAQASAAR